MPLYEGNISHVTLSGIIDLIQWFSLKKIEYKFCFISKVVVERESGLCVVTKIGPRQACET